MRQRGPVARDVTVVVSNYSLCPKVSLAEITRQSRAAVAWIAKNIAHYNGNPQRLFVAGHSELRHTVEMQALGWLQARQVARIDQIGRAHV